MENLDLIKKFINIDEYQYVMKKQTALKTLFWISLAGVLFSGYLSYTEIFQEVCLLGTCSTTIFTIPSCVYGFIMYFAISIISIIGIKSKK
ncbi:MAG: hypothetical protein QT05_C0027G0006 [archaeon GW2011_AR13]|nr:MAG: hypothetical protein QT05_C0027G0006 [archaeon GW2011_AR13]